MHDPFPPLTCQFPNLAVFVHEQSSISNTRRLASTSAQYVQHSSRSSRSRVCFFTPKHFVQLGNPRRKLHTNGARAVQISSPDIDTVWMPVGVPATRFAPTCPPRKLSITALAPTLDSRICPARPNNLLGTYRKLYPSTRTASTLRLSHSTLASSMVLEC